jgi:hypothetical protein
MRKHCLRKICDDLKCSLALSWTSNTNDIFLMGLTLRRQAFRHHTVSIRRSEVTFNVVHPVEVTDATFPLSVMQCCSSRFSCFNSSYPSSERPHIQSSLTTHFEQTFVNSSQPLNFSNQIPGHRRCFNGTTIYAILESTAMLSFINK